MVDVKIKKEEMLNIETLSYEGLTWVNIENPTEKEIKNVIRKIIDSNIAESQFDECEGMTLKSINTIGISFLKKLSSIYHTRISYPGFDFKEKK